MVVTADQRPSNPLQHLGQGIEHSQPSHVSYVDQRPGNPFQHLGQGIEHSQQSHGCYCRSWPRFLCNIWDKEKNNTENFLMVIAECLTTGSLKISGTRNRTQPTIKWFLQQVWPGNPLQHMGQDNNLYVCTILCNICGLNIWQPNISWFLTAETPLQHLRRKERDTTKNTLTK